MPTLPIAAQLYTVRDAMAKDVAGTLRAVAALGYDGVEFAGLYDTPAAELRALLDELGLRAHSAHIGLDLFEGDLDRTLETYAALGCQTLVVPWLAEGRRGDYAALGAALNRIAERVGAAGMRLAYHNHDFELRADGGRTGLDTLLEITDPALVGFELDCGWAAKIGQDPLELMRKLAPRLWLLHVKDVTAGGEWTEAGQGVVDYRSILAAAPDLGVEWLVVEHDNPRPPSIDTLAASLSWLRQNT
jgi:sugar phosphate isomerase/epimerase